MLQPNPEPVEEPLTAVIVEDDVLLRIEAGKAFRDRGFEVVEAETAEEALDYLRAGAPAQVVFTDVEMPGALDGAALAEVLKAEFPAVRVVVTSGSIMPGGLGEEVSFVPKPYDPRDVADRIRDEIRRGFRSADPEKPHG